MKRVRCVTCGLMKEGNNMSLPALTDNEERVQNITCDAHKRASL